MALGGIGRYAMRCGAVNPSLSNGPPEALDDEAGMERPQGSGPGLHGLKLNYRPRFVRP